MQRKKLWLREEIRNEKLTIKEVAELAGVSQLLARVRPITTAF